MTDLERTLSDVLRRQLDPLQMPDRLAQISVRTRKRRLILAATTALAVALGALLSWSLVGSDRSPPEREVAAPAAPSSTTPANPPTRPPSDGWTVSALVARSRFGPLRVTVGEVVTATRNNALPWRRHDVVFHNEGAAPLRFDDTRTSVFLPAGGPPRLLAGDEGCGYGFASPGADAEPGACDSYLDAFVVPVGASETREITLSRDLSGMAELVEGRYVFAKPIAFRVRGERGVLRHTIRIVYDVRRDEDSAPKRVAVPDVVGVDLARAVETLRDAGLRVDLSALSKVMRGYATGNQTHPRVRVTNLNPAPGTEVDVGSTVAVLQADCPGKDRSLRC